MPLIVGDAAGVDEPKLAVMRTSFRERPGAVDELLRMPCLQNTVKRQDHIAAQT